MKRPAKTHPERPRVLSAAAPSPILGTMRTRRPKILLTLLLATGIAGCGTRSGPPAPVVDRSGIYYTTPARPVPPVVAAPRTSVASTPLAAPRKRPAPSRRQAPKKETRPATASLAPAGSLVTRPGGAVTVGRGDTLYAISRRLQVPIRALIDANRLAPPYALQVGQRLSVPAVRVYVVAPGDTVTAVSQRFEAPVGDVIRLNALKAPNFGIYAGQRLALPGKVGAAPSPAIQRASVINLPKTPKPPRVVLRDPSAPPPPRAARRFGWPLQGKLLSGFGAKGGGRYNDGINIAAGPGSIIRSAENGIVAYAGNELRGYGNLLLVRHADGWISAYAHIGDFLVRRGQVVKRGQPIGRVGSSGAVNRPQLHFELRRGRRAVDPRRYLES
jgi:murein DD-endopeptidase MepM/ murein hydrolase activator NlpD